MTDHPPAPPLPTAAENLALLARIAARGMQMLDHLTDQALAAPPGAPEAAPEAAPAIALAFSRYARAVRQAIALQHRIEQDQRATPTQDQRAATAAARIADARAARINRHRAQIRDGVAAAIDEQAEPERAENLLLDLEDRLEDDDIAALLGRCAPQALIIRIAKDLGLKSDLGQLSDEELHIQLVVAEAQEERQRNNLPPYGSHDQSNGAVHPPPPARARPP